MGPKLPADYVPPGGARRQGVTTRSHSTDPQTNDPPLSDPAPLDQAGQGAGDDSLAHPTSKASAVRSSSTKTVDDDDRSAAVEAALGETERALACEQTTIADLARQLQQERDIVAQLRRAVPSSRSASGSKKPSRDAKKDKKPKERKEPTPEPVKVQDPAELLSHLQALLQVYGARPPLAPPTRGRRTRKGPRRHRRGDTPTKRSRRHASSSSSTSSTRSSASSSTTTASGPPTPPSPPSSPSDSSDGTSSEGGQVPTPRRHRGPPRATRREVYDRHLAVQAPNRRYRRLLSYKTYFLADTRLAYSPRQVRKASRLNKCLDGPFQGQAPFTGKDPLAVFGFLSTFKRACDAAGASHGQAFPLISFRLAGAAKQSFVSAVSHSSTADRYAIRTYGEAVNWLIQKYATPDKLNEAYTEIISAHQEQEEAPRAFSERLERMCDRLDGLFHGEDVVDTFINGLHEAVKAHVLTFQMSVGQVALPQAVTTAQIYWTGIQKMKIDLRRHVRNTTTPIRVGALTDATSSVTPPMPPRFARVDRAPAGALGSRPASPSATRGRSPSPRRVATATDSCFNCQGLGHFSAECPEPRRERARRPEREGARVNVVTDEPTRDEAQDQEN